MSQTGGTAAVDPPTEWVQVWFPMSGGPATSLGMGAELLAPDRVRLHIAPWAVLDAAKGDILRVRREKDGQLWVQEKLEASGYCAIRVTLTADSPLGAIDSGVEAVLDRFAVLGVTGLGMFGLVVIDVPPEADFFQVHLLLDKGQRDGWWDYDELCVTDAWKTVTSR